MDLFENTQIGALNVENHCLRSASFAGKATEKGYPTEAIKDIDGNPAMAVWAQS